MQEIISQRRQEKIKEKEEFRPLTDGEISEANALLNRRGGSDNPLAENEKLKWKELEERRTKECNDLFPEFDFGTIAEMTGNRDESTKQFEIAKKYFKNIAEMAEVPGALYNFALRLEKLQNRDRDPRKIEAVFPKTFRDRINEFRKLVQDVDDANRARYVISDKKWQEFVIGAKSGKVPREEIERIEELIGRERLTNLADVPNHLREAVIYEPSLLGEALNKLKNLYFIKGSDRTHFIKRISRRRARIEEFERLKKNRR